MEVAVVAGGVLVAAVVVGAVAVAVVASPYGLANLPTAAVVAAVAGVLREVGPEAAVVVAGRASQATAAVGRVEEVAVAAVAGN